MTLEEAGQRLLEGNPWVRCNNCKGIGYKWLHSGRGTELEKLLCADCCGLTAVLEDEYKEACRLLNMPEPQLQDILDSLTGKKHSDPDSIGG